MPRWRAFGLIAARLNAGVRVEAIARFAMIDDRKLQEIRKLWAERGRKERAALEKALTSPRNYFKDSDRVPSDLKADVEECEIVAHGTIPGSAMRWSPLACALYGSTASNSTFHMSIL